MVPHGSIVNFLRKVVNIAIRRCLRQVANLVQTFLQQGSTTDLDEIPKDVLESIQSQCTLTSRNEFLTNAASGALEQHRPVARHAKPEFSGVHEPIFEDHHHLTFGELCDEHTPSDGPGSISSEVVHHYERSSWSPGNDLKRRVLDEMKSDNGLGLTAVFYLLATIKLPGMKIIEVGGTHDIDDWEQ
ncbi:hypothetical protein KCU66_g24, partial [Aureobasidium melanogenum]